MKTLVIYDSNYGNTKIIAEEIAKGLGENTQCISVVDCTEHTLEGVELLVVGSPINGWRPSPRMNEYLLKLKPHQLDNVKAAAFDTRVKVFYHGDAVKKIASHLKKAGASIIVKPQPFYVQGIEGPLLQEEVKNAYEWGKEIHSTYQKDQL
jgi:flavodoxin